MTTRLICGDDDIETWSAIPGVWDGVLKHTRVIVSTYQILFDAVAHALVPLSALSLIVIDEAHHCIKMNPVSRVMKEHYAPLKAKGAQVPAVLGLTASPVMRTNPADLQKLEQTLFAVCKTPSRHRAELMQMVTKPDLVTVTYPRDPQGQVPEPPVLGRLIAAYRGMQLAQDPYVQHLVMDGSQRSRAKLQKVVSKRKTRSMEHMYALCIRTKDMLQRLGPWAAEYYIHEVISAFFDDPEASTGPLDEEEVELHNPIFEYNLQVQERRYISSILSQVNAQPPATTDQGPSPLSPKILALLDVLESFAKDDPSRKPVGIIFVRERATAAVLSHILSIHPRTAPHYRVACMVGGTTRVPGSGGGSRSNKRRGYIDLIKKGKDDGLEALQAFRQGEVNLVVATSVLEEGIDVPACNLVVCFDVPENLKSFIQRRGRARMGVSKLVLMVPEGERAKGWDEREREMKEMYEDDMRVVRIVEEIENGIVVETEKEDEYPVLRDPETGAQVTLHDAKAHLEHFCGTLRSSTSAFTELRPFYILHGEHGQSVNTFAPVPLRATVHLPVVLPPELRRIEGIRSWLSEADACRDAAFQAYQKLYEAGLVGKHLLPIREESVFGELESRDGLANVKDVMDPWVAVAQAWRQSKKLWKRGMTLTRVRDGEQIRWEVVLPVEVPRMEKFFMFYDKETSWEVTMDQDQEAIDRPEDTQTEPDDTPALLSLAFSHRFRILGKGEYVLRLLCPSLPSSLTFQGRVTERLLKRHPDHLLRWVHDRNYPFGDHTFLPPREPENEPQVGMRKVLPHKAGFFRKNSAPDAMPVSMGQNGEPKFDRIVPLREVVMDAVPAKYAEAALMIPALLVVLGDHLLARDLLTERLREKTGMGGDDLGSVVRALWASGAQRPGDYENMEFLGDALLKFLTTVNCEAKCNPLP